MYGVLKSLRLISIYLQIPDGLAESKTLQDTVSGTGLTKTSKTSETLPRALW